MGKITRVNVCQRVAPSVAAALLAAERGARVLRVHDVRETLAALQVRGAMIAADSSTGTESSK